MKNMPVPLTGFLALCCCNGITLAATPPDIDEPSVQPEVSHTRDKSPTSEVDISGVINHLRNQNVERARSELTRLLKKNPGWHPPVSLEQAINDYPRNSPEDSRYLLLMAELTATPESARTTIPTQRLEHAKKEVQLRKDGYHAMILGWIYFQRKDYATSGQLFTKAGSWGEEEQSRKARSLVSLRLAHQSVAANDHAAALRHAEQSDAMGNHNGFTSTGWLLFKKQAYDDAFTAFSSAPDSAAKEQALAETCLEQSRLALAARDDARAEQAARCSQQHGRSDALTTLGWTLYDSDQYARASHFFAAQQPPSEQSSYGNALSLRAGGDIQQASELACSQSQTSLRIKSLCVELISAQMQADYQAENYDAVLRQASELVKFTELSQGQRALLAWSELSAGQHEIAARHFDKLLTEQPDETSHAHGLLNSLAKSGDTMALADARERHPLLGRIINSQASATELPQKELNIASPQTKPSGSTSAATDADPLSRAIELFHAKNYKSSHALFQELRPGIIESRDAGLLTLAGWAAFHSGEFTEARDNFLLATEWKDDASIWLMVVEAEIALQNLERAREIVDGLPASPERNKMLSRLTVQQAVAAYQNKNYVQAETLLSSPDITLNDENLELLGWSRYQQGKYEAAVPPFEAAYRSKPTLARAKGLVFSHIHLRQPGKLVALADELQGPLAELTADDEVRRKLSEGKEDWVGVSPEGELIVQEPPKQTPLLIRTLQKLEGIPGYTWGSVDHSFVDDETSISFIINQGIDWLVLPGDLTLNTFIEYRSIDNDWRALYEGDEFAYGLELQRSPFWGGIEHLPAEWGNEDQAKDLTNAYIGWYHSWYKYLRRRRSTISNPLNANAYSGSTYGRVSHELKGEGNTTTRGFVRQGVDWFTTVTKAGEITLNTYAEYRFRYRTEQNYWYNAHGPVIGIELQRSPFRLGMEYMWQYNPEQNTEENKYGLYLTWYYDWDLKPD